MLFIVPHKTLGLILSQVFTCDFLKTQTASCCLLRYTPRAFGSNLVLVWSGHAARSLLSASVHSTTLHLRYQTKRTLQRGLWCLIILSTGDDYWSLVRALSGVSTPSMPKLGDQIRPSFFLCDFFFFSEKVMSWVERFLWIQIIWYDLPLERGLWMNAEPPSLLHEPDRRVKGWVWVS